MKPLLRRVVLGALCLPRALTAQTPVRFSVQEIATLPQAASAQPLFVLPKPTGAHHVGRIEFHVLDSTRREVMTPNEFPAIHRAPAGVSW